MEIKQYQSKEKGKFFIGEETPLAEIVYRISGNDLTIEHTEVDPSLRGKDIGKRLVEKVIEYARQHHLSIIPACPYARAMMMRRRDEFSDVLKLNV